jgi:hypothetical protein
MDNKFEKRVKEFGEEFEKWENSLEGVLYNLKTWGDATIQDTKDSILIAKTLLKLPKEIREKVLDEVTFVFTRAAGTIVTPVFVKCVEKEELERLPSRDAIVKIKAPMIVLNFSEMKISGMKKYTEMDVIAHEIAHFVLGHKTGGGSNREREADDLCEKWGFNRCWTDEEIAELFS